MADQSHTNGKDDTPRPQVHSGERRTSERVSVQSVAELAGVSKTTVSHILNRKQPYFEQFSQETIDRVLRCARELNYRPNILASGLKTGRSRLFAVTFQIFQMVTDTDDAKRMDTGFDDLLLSGASLAALRNRYFPVIGLYDVREPAVEIDTIDSLVQAGVGGLLIKAPTEGAGVYLRDLVRRRFPLVELFPQSDPITPCYVDMDNVHAGRMAVEHLLELGHTRIGFASAVPYLNYDRQRYEGYCAAMKDAGLEPLDALHVSEDAEKNIPPDEIRRIRAYLVDHQITGMYVTQGGVSILLLIVLKEMDRPVPENLAVVGTDVRDWRLHGIPPITSVSTSWFKAGERSVEKLIGLMEEPSAALEPTFIQPDLTVQATSIPASRVRSRR